MPAPEANATAAMAMMAYRWSAKCTMASGEEEGTTVDDLAAISSTRTTDPVLVIRRGGLLAGATYRFTLRAWDGEYEGVNAVDVVTNSFDQAGAMSVEPVDGVAVSDSFQLEADGFVDADIPLHYSFLQSTPGAAGLEGAGRRLLTGASLSPYAGSVLLGQGEAANGYEYPLCVVVADAYGDTAEAEAAVRVRPFVSAGLLAGTAAARLDEIESSDTVQMMQVVAAFAQGINANANGDDDSGVEPMSEEAVIDSIKTREVLADALLQVATQITADTAEEPQPSIDGLGRPPRMWAKVELLTDALRLVTADTTQLSESSLNSTLSAIELITTGTAGAVGTGMLPQEHVGSVAMITSNLLQATATPAKAAAAAAAAATSGRRLAGFHVPPLRRIVL
jgi:hypothetical protein